MSNQLRTALLIFLSSVVALPALAQTYNFQIIDVGSGYCTILRGINNRGAIVGYSGGPVCSEPFFGLKRHANGYLEYPFAVPPNYVSPELWGINEYGVAVGSYQDQTNSNQYHGFILSRGTFQTVDYAPGVSTELRAINNRGDVAGIFHNLTTGITYYHGFLIVNGTTITQFDIPGCIHVQVMGLAWDRTVVGYCDGVAFLRGPQGKILKFRAAGFPSAEATGINNAAGKIVGNASDNTGPIPHGFIYDYVKDLALASEHDFAGVRVVQVEFIQDPWGNPYLSGINAKGMIIGMTAKGGNWIDDPVFGFIATPIP